MDPGFSVAVSPGPRPWNTTFRDVVARPGFGSRPGGPTAPRKLHQRRHPRHIFDREQPVLRDVGHQLLVSRTIKRVRNAVCRISGERDRTGSAANRGPHRAHGTQSRMRSTAFGEMHVCPDPRSATAPTHGDQEGRRARIPEGCGSAAAGPSSTRRSFDSQRAFTVTKAAGARDAEFACPPALHALDVSSPTWWCRGSSRDERGAHMSIWIDRKGPREGWNRRRAATGLQTSRNVDA